MKALILAAGLGTRLAPITDDFPKCMTEVSDGKTIIEKQIDNLLDVGISDIIVISGYKDEILRNFLFKKYNTVTIVKSVEYKNTNNMYSAFLAKDYINGDAFVMMNADVFFDISVLESLLEFDSPNAIVTDIGRYIEESMKVVECNGLLIKISKDILPNEALGSSIDVYKFSKESGDLFFSICNEYINIQNKRTLWSEVAINDIFVCSNFKACPLNGRWYEIDNHEDLIAARNLFSKDD